MKRIIVISMFCMMTSLAHAQLCPTTEEIYVKRGDQYIPVPPPGWQFNYAWESRIHAPEKLVFGIAAWGSSKHPPTNEEQHVRCYYYTNPIDNTNQVAIETTAQLDESKIVTHQEWKGGNHYYMCTDFRVHDVNACPFN